MERVQSGIVFSNDIFRIMQGQNALGFDYNKNGLIIPNERQIEVMRNDFKKDVNRIFNGDVTIFSEEEMDGFLYDSLADSWEFPIVSLDQIYFKGEMDSTFLDCTRLDGTNEVISRKNPNETASVDNQIKEIAEKTKAKGKDEVILVDDVVFSGNVLKMIIKKLKQAGIEVSGIRASISTDESYRYFNQVLRKGLKCGCILGEEVIDQVCERDFYFGIAQSGIATRNSEGRIIKSPYFKPFGNPVKRASIPKKYEEFFSNGCLMRSMYLWKCIEDNCGRKIYMDEMPETNVNTNTNDRVLYTLRRGVIYYEKDTDRDYGECR